MIDLTDLLWQYFHFSMATWTDEMLNGLEFRPLALHPFHALHPVLCPVLFRDPLLPEAEVALDGLPARVVPRRTAHPVDHHGQQNQYDHADDGAD